jgi:hypothetical protein
MTMRLALIAVLLLAGCTTVLLPSASTDPQWAGKCYEVTHAYVIGWGYALADAIDGWRCKGLKQGDLARTGDRGDSPSPPPKAATAPAAPSPTVESSSKPAEPTWATGE